MELIQNGREERGGFRGFIGLRLEKLRKGVVDKNQIYVELLNKLPLEIVNEFVIPLAELDSIMHKNIVAFLMLLDEKGYCIKEK